MAMSKKEREEILKKILPPDEKKLTTDSENVIFSTVKGFHYEKGYDDGYSDGFEDGSTKVYDNECNIFHEGVRLTLDRLVEYLKYYKGMPIPYDRIIVLCERVYNDIADSYGKI